MIFNNKILDFEQTVDMVKFRIVWWFKHHGKGSKDATTAILLNLKDRCEKVKPMKRINVETWIPPIMDMLKFNVDGSARGSPSPPGIKGVLRDSQGRVLCLFSFHIGKQYSNTVEIRAIRKAVEICASNNDLIGRNIIIISDSKTTVLWVNNEDFGNLDHVDRIYEIRNKLVLMGNTKVIFIPRSTNSFVDMLAKRGSNKVRDVLEMGDV
ncbi:hypothetical protein Dsin_017924 [Dipteronia sinensis]|uniref:RNase H type-1 domain-containing protein n=1 Tax=Dipteronia sinensis TaxID=43782 RepID=A0AAE0E8D6_9ROSI|nr:hypothetical protein Dsin_017924 [Dipteronia sinensis]